MRRFFLVMAALMVFAMPVIAEDGVLNKLNSILDQFRTGYSELTTGLDSLKMGQEQLQAAQGQLSLGLIDLRQGLGTLTTASTILSEEQTRLDGELNNLAISFSDYVSETDGQIAGLVAQNRRQKIIFGVAGGVITVISVISLVGGK